MPRPPATQFSSLTHLIQQTAEKRHLVASETPLTATVVASFLDRIEFVETINAALTWAQSQWRVSPGNLGKNHCSASLHPFRVTSPDLQHL